MKFGSIFLRCYHYLLRVSLIARVTGGPPATLNKASRSTTPFPTVSILLIARAHSLIRACTFVDELVAVAEVLRGLE